MVPESCRCCSYNLIASSTVVLLRRANSASSSFLVACASFSLLNQRVSSTLSASLFPGSMIRIRQRRRALFHDGPSTLGRSSRRRMFSPFEAAARTLSHDPATVIHVPPLRQRLDREGWQSHLL